MYIETDQPPEPVPLTLGCMPALFVGIGEAPRIPRPSAMRYANPRVKDPCPQISWPRMSQPSNASEDRCPILSRRNRQPESYLFSTKHDGGRIGSERWA